MVVIVDFMTNRDANWLSGRHINIDKIQLRPMRANSLIFLKEDDHEQFQKN